MDRISTHFAGWGDASSPATGFVAFAWDMAQETHTALADGAGAAFEQLASDVAYSINQTDGERVSDADAAAWLLEHRARLVDALLRR